MNKFIKSKVDLTPKRANLTQIIEENKRENIDPLVRNNYTEEQEQKDKIRTEEIIDGLSENVAKKVELENKIDDLAQKVSTEQKEGKKVDGKVEKELLKATSELQKVEQKSEKLHEEHREIAQRRRGKQIAPLKSEKFTRHTIIIRKEYLNFWQAMSRLNSKITLTDILDGIFKTIIDEMDESEKKEILKEVERKFKFFDKYGIGKENK